MTREKGYLEFSGLISKNGKMKSVFDLIDKFAGLKSPVLIIGETGSGKELVAKAIHERSQRTENPFIAINCAVLSENLLESELFGHEKGAYTGAFSKKHGLFEVADKGTIFLDEITDMPQKVQAKVLRVIETKNFRRLGGTKTVDVDVRIVSASPVDPTTLISSRTFRGDLYYRLSTLTIEIPPLRERRDDVSLLANYFMNVFSERLGKKVMGIDENAVEVLQSYDWPGNVRELENVIERSFILADGDTLTVEDLPERLQWSDRKVLEEGILTLKETERRHIARVLREVKGNRSLAAEILGIDRKTLYRKIQEGRNDPNLH
ncbi:sigma-54-dependent Fis family transcriptional regulator [candidate division TA06 bacterium]|nr:sigma-54-dependent Fis family transcriptional regulator [candidate division TA06 bacterium]